ncbi:hypothetical protein ACFFHJ_39495, partial [Planotetraspora thailandica]|uniref:hypothetical protein n=1 Tax=Planotetraspora thailandica TaxID=487172 RepID=UPI0035E7FC9E
QPPPTKPPEQNQPKHPREKIIQSIESASWDGSISPPKARQSRTGHEAGIRGRAGRRDPSGIIADHGLGISK